MPIFNSGLDVLGNVIVTGTLSKVGGTNTQFLKADGSVDSNTYLTSSHNHAGVYEPVISTGTATQYWRGDKTWQTLPVTPAWAMAGTKPTYTFSELLTKPTTHAGYGITDTPWTAYLPLAGGTMSNTNLVTNLNADLLDGLHSSAFTLVSNSAGITYNNSSSYSVPAAMPESWFKIYSGGGNLSVIYLDLFVSYDNSTSLDKVVVTLAGYNMRHHITSTTSNYNNSPLLEVKTNEPTSGTTEIWIRCKAGTTAGILTIKSSVAIPTLIPATPTFVGNNIVSVIYGANRLSNSMLITRGIQIDGYNVWHAGNLTNLNQLTTRNFADLQNKPTTLAGYGITDSFPTPGGISVDVSSTNLNVLTKVGFYRGTTLTNAPDSGWWYITVESHDNNSNVSTGWTKQVATSYGAGNSYSSGTTFIRTRAGSLTWGAWIKLLDTVNLVNPITGTGTTNYIPKFTGAGSLGNSSIFDNGTNVGIGTTAPGIYKLNVKGVASFGDATVDAQNVIISAITYAQIDFRSSANTYSMGIRAGGGFTFTNAVGNASVFSLGSDATAGRIGVLNNNVSFNANGVGNVGIGWANGYTIPSKLTVVGSGTTSASSSFNIQNSAFSSLLLVKDDGNVGIGTTIPTKILDVNGDILVNGSVLGRGPGNSSTNIVFGYNALASNTTGTVNVAIGYQALNRNTTGSLNLALGYSACDYNTTGVSNTGIGAQALNNNSTGSYNTAIGNKALYGLGSGSENTGIGYGALWNTTGGYNTAIGSFALMTNTAGQFNVAIGRYTAWSSTGDHNTGIGHLALYNLTTGTYNTVIGTQAGYGITTGSGNTIIGATGTALPANLTNNIILSSGTGAIKAQHDGNDWSFTGNVLLGGAVNIDSSMLTMQSTTKGILIPRMTNAEMLAIGTAVDGLQVYNTTDKKPYWFNGTAWTTNSVGGDGSFLPLSGGTLTETVGNNPSFNDMGTLKLKSSAANYYGPSLELDNNVQKWIIFNTSANYGANANKLFIANKTTGAFALAIDNAGRMSINKGVTTGTGVEFLTVRGDIVAEGSSFIANTVGFGAGNWARAVTQLKDNVGNPLFTVGAYGNGPTTLEYGFLSISGGAFWENPLMAFRNNNIIINGSTDVPSAILNINSTTKGFLLPQMTTTQMNAINMPANGLQVYNTTENKIYWFNATAWTTGGAGGGGTTYTSSGGILLTGSNFTPVYGTTANTVTQGNDSRLNDARTPLTHVHSWGDITPSTRPTTTVGYGITDAALQDGTILYHSVKWFTPTGTVSSNGTTVTSISTQFTSGMVGGKLTINGESRIITAYTNATTVVVASAYSQNYSGVVAGNWGVYSKYLEILNNGDENEYTYTGSKSKWMHSGGSIFYYSDFGQGNDSWRLRGDGLWNGANSVINWGSTSGSLSTRDLGLRRNAAGILEIFDGITATGLEANRRDILVRNITSTGGTSTQWNTAFGWGNHSGLYSLLGHTHSYENPLTFVATGNATVTRVGDTITIGATAGTTYSAGTSATLGLIKLASDVVQTVAFNAATVTALRTYAVQLNAAGQAVVNVPWVEGTGGGGGVDTTAIHKTGDETAAGIKTFTDKMILLQAADNNRLSPTLRWGKNSTNYAGLWSPSDWNTAFGFTNDSGGFVNIYGNGTFTFWTDGNPRAGVGFGGYYVKNSSVFGFAAADVVTPTGLTADTAISRISANVMAVGNGTSGDYSGTLVTGSALLGTNVAVASSKLTINSTTQGILIPRMTTTEMNAISLPADGLQVYNITDKKLYYFNATAWTATSGSGGGSSDGNNYLTSVTAAAGGQLTFGRSGLTDLVLATHTHYPANITTDVNNRFVTDAQITAWNDKQVKNPYNSTNSKPFLKADDYGTGVVLDYTVYAPLNAPAFTGIPSAPTAAPGTSTTQLATTAFVEETKKITVRKISTATTLANSDNGQVILLTASATVTLPNGLMSGFNVSFATQSGATLTYLLGASVILINNTGLTMGPSSSHTLVNTGVTNEYLTVGL